jgi:hypothetical protein
MLLRKYIIKHLSSNFSTVFAVVFNLMAVNAPRFSKIIKGTKKPLCGKKENKMETFGLCFYKLVQHEKTRF